MDKDQLGGSSDVQVRGPDWGQGRRREGIFRPMQVKLQREKLTELTTVDMHI